MQRIRLKAYGKVNLGLDVVRRREDGYHEVRMIMQTVNIYDRIEIVRTRNPGILVNTNLYYLPVDGDNLVYKAAELLIKEFAIQEGVAIDLKKYIPVAAGMAGGSSDAAAVLHGMNRMFGLGLSLEALMKRGVLLGADVPYCLLRGTALAEGIGEVLTSLPPMPQCHIVIVKPNVSVSTKFIYQNLKVDELKQHPDIEGMRLAIEQKDFYGVTARLGNVLETVAIPEYPVIARIKEFLIGHGAVNALMSGSGPTVFGLYDNKEKAEHALHQIRMTELAKQTYLTVFLNRRK